MVMDASGILICLEGIDGAGKTTLAHSAVNILTAKGSKITFVDKKDLMFSMEPHVLTQMKHLKAGLWDYPETLQLDHLPDRYWIYTISAWYSTLKRIRIDSLLAQGISVIVDGWTYKYLARFSLKSKETAQVAREVFSTVPAPDVVINLTLDPGTAAMRKMKFKSSEAGEYDGEVGSKRDGFVSYQTKVMAVLNSLAQENRWLSLDVDAVSIEQCSLNVANLIAEFDH